jgi:PhoH-like ATPase
MMFALIKILGGLHMAKTFVLDTNVLLQSPNSLMSFGKDNKVVLTEGVLEELDNFKKGTSELNVHARTVARFLDELRQHGKLTDGVVMDNGGILQVEVNHKAIELPPSWDKLKVDNRILQVCKALQDKGEEVYLITKDILERIKADIMGVFADDFKDDQAPILDEQYKGRRDVYISPADLDKYFNKGNIDLNDIEIYDDKGELVVNLISNEFVIIHDLTNLKRTGLGKVNHNGKFIENLKHEDEHPYGITPRNVGQRFMQEVLMASVEDIPLVIIKGPAGTAKTFYSLAVGLDKVVDQHEYRRILVCRPNMAMDEELGFLPGDERQKIAPLMRPIFDNLEILVDSDNKKRYNDEEELADKVQELFERQYIDMQAVGFLRGRSIAKQWILIDEAQNLTPKQAKAIITRAGEGTKIILVGDPEQNDNPFLDGRTNGLSYAAEKMKGSRLCIQLTLDDEECVRSKLAMEGAQRMR